MRQTLFYVAYGLIAKIASQATSKSWQAFIRRRFEACLIAFDEIQRISICNRFQHYPISDDLHIASVSNNASFGRQTNNRVAPESLPALHGFKQVRKWLVSKFEIERKRCVEVGKGLDHQRNTVEAFRSEGFKLLFT